MLDPVAVNLSQSVLVVAVVLSVALSFLTYQRLLLMLVVHQIFDYQY